MWYISVHLYEENPNINTRACTSKSDVQVTNTLDIIYLLLQVSTVKLLHSGSTRWFKYDRDYLCVNKSQFVPVIFEPPCMSEIIHSTNTGLYCRCKVIYSLPEAAD
jgi:hypothetical protein